MNLSKAPYFVAALMIAFVPLASAQGTFTQIDYPGAVETSCIAINSAGDTVGFFKDTDSNTHGFLLSSGTFTQLDVPGASSTQAFGINDLGQIVGFNGTGSFSYDIATQTFSPIVHPGPGTATVAFGINNRGTIVGYIKNLGSSTEDGFKLKGTKYTKIDYPQSGVKATYLLNISNSGVIIGWVATDNNLESFWYAQKQFKIVNIPGAFSPLALGINDQKALVGTYFDGTQESGWLYEKGNFQTLNPPGSVLTYAYSINNSGEVTGYFDDADGLAHGFTWTPAADAAKK